jgi:hypothetical protein
MKNLLLTLGSFCLFLSQPMAQCADGWVEVTMNVYSDAWAYESYWELVNAGSACGENTLDFGANSNVGCEGVGADNSPDGYNNNTLYTEGPWCFEVGTMLDLIFVDSYGDGGLVFEIFENGNLSHFFQGSGSGSTHSFEIGNSVLPAYDSPCGAIEVSANGGIYSLNNVLAVASFNEIAPGGDDCSIYGFWCEGATSNTVWAYFVPNEPGQYSISTCIPGTNMDTQLALYKGNDCSQLASFELVSANDDAFGGCEGADVFSSTLFTGCLEVGATYYIQIDGWNGATGDINLELTTVEPVSSLEGSPRDTPCPLDKKDEPEGSIYVWLTESASNFTALWTGPNGYSGTGNNINNLATGTYNVTVTSGCGDVFNGSYTLNEPDSWNITTDIVSPDCSQSENGAINVSVSGATPDYTYFWTGPGNFTSANQDLSAITPGQYDLLITDDRDCQYTINQLVEPIDDLVLDLGADTVVCQNVVFAVSAPVGYTYLWQDESQNQVFLVNAAEFGIGDHYLICTISTPDGCSAADVYNFTVDACIGVEEATAQTRALLYPNPTQGVFRVEWANRERASIAVRDALGKTVHTFHSPAASTGEELQLDLPTGFYTVLLELGNTVQVLPLIVE